MAAIWAACVLTSILSCGPSDVLTLPESVESVVWLVDGRASPWIPLEGGAAVRAPPNRELRLFGFGPGAVDPDGADRSQPLEPRGSCPALPVPVWYAEVAAEGAATRELNPLESPSLGAAWVEAACGGFEPARLTVVDDCRSFPCVESVESMAPCLARVRFRALCDLPDLNVGFAPDGNGPEAAVPQCASSSDWACTRSGASSFRCQPPAGPCGIQLRYAPVLPFSIRSFRYRDPGDRLSEVLPERLPGPNLFPRFDFLLPTWGAFDALIRGDSVLVATSAEDDADTACFDGFRGSTRLWQLDLETWTSRASRLEDQCILALSATPTPGFSGLMRRPPRTIRTARFDEAGVLVSEGDRTQTYEGVGRTSLLGASVREQQMLAVLAEPQDGDDAQFGVAVFDLRDDTLTSSVSTARGNLRQPITAAVILPGGEILGAYDETGPCSLGNLDGLNGGCPPIPGSEALLQDAFDDPDFIVTAGWAHPNDGLWVMVGGGAEERVIMIGQLGRVPPFQVVPMEGRDLFPTSVAPWVDGRHLIVGGYRALEDAEEGFRVEGAVRLLDLQTRRMQPGLWVLGEGPVERLVADDQGVTALLPWSGQFVRLDPI